MTRWWVEVIAQVTDVIPLSLLVILMISTAALTGILWYYWPAWIPRGLPRRPRWLHREKLATSQEEIELTDEDIKDIDNLLPDLPTSLFLSRADLFRRQGRYAEAIRERLRAIMRTLVDLNIIDSLPGLTITELATIAARQQPAIMAPLGEACDIFSLIWYALTPADIDHDDRMMVLTTEINRILTSSHTDNLSAVGGP